MGVSPSQGKGKKGNHICPEESTSEKAQDFGSEYLLTELSENKQQCSNAVTQNEPANIPAGMSGSGMHEPSSEYMAKNSSPEHFCKGVSGHKHTGESICPQETVLGKTDEHGSEDVHKETSEEKHKCGSEIAQNVEDACTSVCGLPAKNLQPFSEGLSKNGTTESSGVLPEDLSKCIQTEELSCPQIGSSKPTIDFGSGNICKELDEPPEQQQQLKFESLPNGREKGTTAVTPNVLNQAMQLKPANTNKSHCGEHLQSHTEEFATGDPGIEQSRLPCEDMASGVQKEEKKPRYLIKHSARRKTSKAFKKKYMLRSSSSDRVLRSKSQEKPDASEPSNNLADVGSSKQKRRTKRKKKKRGKGEAADEYSRIRTHLRYLLNRINYEQNLIDAYSTEGWKGLSLEKLKPEKELQRATSEILRRKLKIRDLFQRIDSLSAEGRLPESLFDSEGQIDSEDIFCAKCGSKDLSANNDIILCDGACDRGFHQYCLQPPLLKEDKTDEKDQGDESSSDESDFTSTSEDLEVPANVDPYLGLPSDDSEDDDFNPDNPDHDDVVKPESSSSDFTSDSEDLGATLEGNTSSQKDEGPFSSSALRDSKRGKAKLGGKASLNDELTELASEQDGSTFSKKRTIERLDYKRLYDETYGNVPSSSSDDENWGDTTMPRKRRKQTAEAISAPANGNVSASSRPLASNNLKQSPKESEHKSRRKTRQTSKLKDTDSSPAELQGGTSVPSSSGKKAGSSSYRRLGEAEKQRLYSSFKENQYPDRATKESLAKELEMTLQQVSKWFDNTRWSYHNTPSMSAKIVSATDITSSVPKKNN
ncbi:hypothetical protein COLO4_32568 [Corchorus olitorius]|uniref:Homeobox domain-containing protein n=1 Tax=Corchorus olitorius TaxID=93759 RepID=A0A1R3GYV0_9ROSI|nr:hypothetical protein COLO4_32568 [Corchorus olitorius]